jgi:hypothetical protein
MDAWKKFEELQMKRDMMMANINMQRGILEIQKLMWDKHNNKNQMEEKQTKLNIQNIQKLENQPLVDGKYYPRIESIEETDNEYLFTILVDIGVNLLNVRKVICLERNKNLTSDSGINFYKLWAAARWTGDENFDSVSSMCISNLESFKEKLLDMVGMDSLSMSGGPTSSIAYFTDTNSVSGGGDSEKLQRLSDFFNNI